MVSPVVTIMDEYGSTTEWCLALHGHMCAMHIPSHYMQTAICLHYGQGDR